MIELKEQYVRMPGTALRRGPYQGGFMLNNGLLNIHTGFAFLPIPKSANMGVHDYINNTQQVEDWLGLTHYIDLDAHISKIKQVLCILRNPYKRFISGTNMFLVHGLPNDNHKLSQPIHDRRDHGQKSRDKKNLVEIVDTHFFPQTYFLKKIPEKFDFFYLDDNNVLKDIISYYGWAQERNTDYDPYTNLNASAKVVTDINKAYIKELYAEDFEFIKNVEFKNTNEVTLH